MSAKAGSSFFIKAGFPIVFCMLIHAYGQESSTMGVNAIKPLSLAMLAKMVLPGTKDLQLIIELSQLSVVESLSLSRAGGYVPLVARPGTPIRLDPSSARVSLARNQIAADQRRVLQRLQALRGVVIQSATDIVINTIIARVPSDQYDAVCNLPGVKNVYFSRPRRMTLNGAANMHNAQGMWAVAGGSANAGAGVKIGIIDSGIDITNPMFIDSSLTLPAGYPKGETDLTNNKVIVARNFLSMLPNYQPVRTAVDEAGHGTFVAGCAAGKNTVAPLASISGMAPGAFLGNYKVFGTPGINDYTTSATVMTAIDAAVADGMDVINLSLGSLDYQPAAEDPEITAIARATSAGVVVVISAGNDGADPYTINNPANAPDAITVGGVTNQHVFTSMMHVMGSASPNLKNIPYIPGSGLVYNKFSGYELVDVGSLDGTGQACSPHAPLGRLAGKIALIARGGCSFYAKIKNVMNVSPRAMVFYDTVTGSDAFLMDGFGLWATPVVSISNADGLALKSISAGWPGGVKIAVDESWALSSKASWKLVLSDWSSAGPSIEFGLKPDLVAVGENIYCATKSSKSADSSSNTPEYTVSSGTSFAAPMVAGAAAVLLQLHPEFTPQAVKSALTTTASRGLTLADGTPANILQIGNGLLDMKNAAAASAIFSPASLSFGLHEYSPSMSLEQSITITNVSATSDQFTLTVEPLVAGPDFLLSTAVTEAIPPGGGTTIKISLKTSRPLTGSFQGYVAARSESSSSVYRIPYWAGIYMLDASRILKVAKTANGAGGAFNTLQEVLAQAQPGNIVEIGDSASYSTGLTLAANREGLLLHNITIRAAAGQTPILTVGAEKADYLGITILGLRNVLLQGLIISGDGTGLWTLQPSQSLPTSVTLDHCTLIGDIPASDSFSGVVVEGGATLNLTGSTISKFLGSGIKALDGAQVNLNRSTLDGNGDSGFNASNANIQILNSTLSNNSKAGATLKACRGTIDGSAFVKNIGTDGDGVDIYSGQVDVTNNVFDSNAYTGIGIFQYAAARIAGNTIRSNLKFGVRADLADVRFEENQILDTKLMINITGSSTGRIINNLAYSQIPLSSGRSCYLKAPAYVEKICDPPNVNIDNPSAIAISNNTMINMGSTNSPTGGLELAISNTIWSSNNGPCVDPARNNFDIRPLDFPLNVDTGQTNGPDLPFLDYKKHLRVASPGLRAGEGKVDKGAVEMGSTYPLVFPLLMNGYQSMLGDNFTTGLAIVNAGTVAANARFASYNANGEFQGPGSITALQAGAQVPVLGSQLFNFDPGMSQLGAVLADSDQKLTGFFLVFDSAFARFADGVPVSSETGTDMVMMQHVSGADIKTTYFLFNPGVNPANVNATLYAPSGEASGAVKTSIIPPKGQFVFSFENSIPSGYVRVRSDRPISGLELTGDSEELSALSAALPGFDGRLYFPHFAVNQGYSTNIGIVNPATGLAKLVLTAFDNSGNILGTPVHYDLYGHAQLLQSVSSLFGLDKDSLKTGYVVVESNLGGLVGFTGFRYDDGHVRSAATVPATSIPRQQLLFSHIAHQVPAGAGGNYLTGIALMNPYGVTVPYTIRVFDGSGLMVAEKTDTIGKNEKIAKFLSHAIPGAGFFTQPLAMGRGHIEVTSDLGLLGFELFFTEDMSQLASVPAQTIK
jgi:minor extracellular serine protease Vpr